MNLKAGLAVNFIVMASSFQITEQDGAYTLTNPIRLPYSSVQGPFMGLFVAISVPLVLPNYNMFFSYNFEANYNLPTNQTQFTYPPLYMRRSWDRRLIYDILEFKMESHGYPGKSCLLRTICEAGLHRFDNSVLGDIIHIILSPSTSTNKNISSEYELAERRGRLKKNCKKYAKNCPISFLDLISLIGSYI